MAEPTVNPLDYGRPQRPCCDAHGVKIEMVPYSVGGVIRYWRCPVPGCPKRGQDLTKYPLRRTRRL
jgi:hypothetical protein